MNKLRNSIEDVARRAKVSITTVSRVINKVPTVSKENVARVEEAISFLKFKPNVTAQRLATGQSTGIGFVMPGYPGIFHSFYAIELIRGIGTVDLAMSPDEVATSFSHLRIYRGYAGWGPGQLDAEIDMGAWMVFDAGSDDVFTGEPSELWRSVLRRQGGRTAWIANAPDDLSAN